MAIRLHNTLTKTSHELQPLSDNTVRIYSCGPTVYDHVHIGNLCAFTVADTLRRTIVANGYTVTHVMNFTDVDDKTIRRSQEEHPDMDPLEALLATTQTYSDIFLKDMKAIGNDVEAFMFVRATDSSTIQGIQQLVTSLHTKGFAYIADDGVYFSIEAYRKSGKKYGQLVEIDEKNTSEERIQNDEYDKESPHDFALWKIEKPGEPAWDFTLEEKNLRGRPGWHIECSVMSREKLGQPFDIHTGGVDLIFPHHENEIAQSTAGETNPTYATIFAHNEHILVDGRKMSKSLGNFYTLRDLTQKGIDPLAFRMLVLQSHYRKATNFSFEAIESATNRLQNWRDIATLRHQIHSTLTETKNTDEHAFSPLAASGAIIEALNDDLNTPEVLRVIDDTFNAIPFDNIDSINRQSFVELLEAIDQTLGLQLLQSTPDIPDSAKQLILKRERARDNKDWAQSDELRDQLAREFALTIRDTINGSVWSYIK